MPAKSFGVIIIKVKIVDLTMVCINMREDKILDVFRRRCRRDLKNFMEIR